MTDLAHPTEDLLEAQRFLRELQAKHPTQGGAVGLALGTSVRDACLAQLAERKKFLPTDDPNMVSRGGLYFNRRLEEQRITLAEDLVRRVDPGPFEDPVYLALIAYQAASIQMALPNRPDGSPSDPGWSNFLIGTVHSAVPDAFVQPFEKHGLTVVVLHSALIEFAYQAAKAVVESQHGRDSQAAERLYRTLEACYFKGRPRAFQNEEVPADQVLPLTHLISMTERWIIAHEIGHCFATRVNWTWAPVESAEKSEEYFADDNATILTALSAARLDGVPPDIALVAGTFALACIDVFQRGLFIIREGKDPGGAGGVDHPLNEVRAQNIVNCYKRFFDPVPNGHPAGIHSPTGSTMGQDRVGANDATLRGRRVFKYCDSLLALWGQVQPRLLADFESGRRLDPTWA